MTTENTKLGREPIVICGLVMDKCSQVAGVGACQATETGDAKCYNTRATCNFPSAYTKTTQEIKFSEPRGSLPVGENLLPALDGRINRASTSTTSGSGLGKRAVVNIKIKDFPHHDRGIDPYYDERTYNALETGTFWGKFIKRNPYYEGRTLKLYHGYLTDPFDWNNFHIEEYDITDISGPSNGMVKITGKDILVRTYERKAKYPELSNGLLSADMTTAATTFSITPTGEGANYPSSGTLAIGKEAMAFTRSGDNFTVTRATWGTDLKSHQLGDTVQLCKAWNSVNVVDALYDLLVNVVGIPSTYIDLTKWNLERDTWLTSSNVKGILIKPEGVEKIISEWSESFMLDIWWEATTQKIEIKALAPDFGNISTLISDDANIKKGSLSLERVSKERYTQIEVFYNKINFADNDDLENFANGFISTDPSRAGSEKYNSNSIKTIKSRWFDDSSQAAQLSGRLLARYSDTPEYIDFKIDAKDYGNLNLSDVISVTTWQFQDFNGRTEARPFQVIEIDEVESGHESRVKCLSSSFSGNYFFFAPEDAPDYADATEDQKAKYGYFVDDTGIYSDGQSGDKII